MKGIIYLLIFIFAFAEDATSSSLTTIKNENIKIIGDNTSGRFIIKTTGGDPNTESDNNALLLFEKHPPTSFTTININNNLFIYGDDNGTFYHNTKCYSFIIKEGRNQNYKFWLSILNSILLIVV